MTDKLINLKDAQNSKKRIAKSSAPLLPSGQIASVLALPLYYMYDRLGVLTFYNIRNHAEEEHNWFTSRDEEEFQDVASHIAKALSQSKIVEERIQAIQKAEQSEQQLVYAGAILSHLVHDLRNRLNDILANLRTLVDDAQNDTDRARALAIEKICETLSLRIKEYLDAITHGRIELKTDTDLYSLLLYAKQRLEEEASRSNISIIIPHGKHNYGHIREGPYLPTDFISVHFGQSQVKDHNIGALRLN